MKFAATLRKWVGLLNLSQIVIQYEDQEIHICVGMGLLLALFDHHAEQCDIATWSTGFLASPVVKTLVTARMLAFVRAVAISMPRCDLR